MNTKIRSPHRLITMANPIISHDNKHFAVEIETEDSLPLDIEIPLSEIGTIVEFLVSISSHQQPDYKPLNLPEQLNISPIKINGLGFAMGNSTEETLLIARLSGFDLAFSLDSNKLEELGLDFARTAQALAANNQNPQ